MDWGSFLTSDPEYLQNNKSYTSLLLHGSTHMLYLANEPSNRALYALCLGEQLRTSSSV